MALSAGWEFPSAYSSTTTFLPRFVFALFASVSILGVELDIDNFLSSTKEFVLMGKNLDNDSCTYFYESITSYCVCCQRTEMTSRSLKNSSSIRLTEPPRQLLQSLMEHTCCT